MDRSLIDKKNARKIKKLIYDNGGKASHEAFNRFVRHEKHCRGDILRLLSKCSKSIVTHFIEHSSYSEEPEDSFENMMEGPDEIDRCMSVAAAFAHTSTLIQTVFAAGMLYGKGIYENDILRSLEGPPRSKPLIGPGPNIAIISTSPSDDKEAENIIASILGNSFPDLMKLMGHNLERERDRDDESEEDRRQTGEESPDVPN